MLDIFFNYAVQAFVSGRNGIVCPPLFCFADYVDCRLVVFDSKMAHMDLSHVASWGGAIDVDENSGTDPLVRLLPGLFNASGAANGEILFPIDCNTAEFLSRISKKTTGSLEIYGYDSSDKRVIRVKVPVDLGLPNDLPGDHEPDMVPPSAVRTLNGLPGNVVIKTAAGEALPAENGVITLPEIEPGISLNGLRGKVEFYDSEGNLIRTENNALWLPEVAGPPGPEGPAGATVIADPVTEMAVADETWGDCRYLDTTFQQLSFRGRVRSLRRVSLETVSIDSGVTGNIVLVPIVNGSELSGTSFVVAVGAVPAVTTFALEVASGTLALRRDTDDERDTLKDAEGSVTAVVLSVILEVQYDA